MAYEAGKRRDHRLLTTLDAVLDRLRLGVNVGGERRLSQMMTGGVRAKELSTWLQEHPARHTGCFEFEIAAALFGDGSKEVAGRVVSRAS